MKGQRQRERRETEIGLRYQEHNGEEGRRRREEKASGRDTKTAGERVDEQTGGEPGELKSNLLKVVDVFNGGCLICCCDKECDLS